MANGIKDALSGVWDSVTGWAGGVIKDGASWATRQVTDGVTSAFTGSASPESNDGFEPGAWLGKMMHGMPWYAWVGGLLGMFLGGSWGSGIGGTMKMGALGLIGGVIAAYAIGSMFSSKKDFSGAAAPKPGSPDAKPVARNVTIGPQSQHALADGPGGMQ